MKIWGGKCMLLALATFWTTHRKSLSFGEIADLGFASPLVAVTILLAALLGRPGKPRLQDCGCERTLARAFHRLPVGGDGEVGIGFVLKIMHRAMALRRDLSGSWIQHHGGSSGGTEIE